MAPIRGLGFLGRTSERRRLDGMLAQARDGRSAVLVIRGEPGIGKTALLRYAARQASGLRVAQVEGIQAEMELPFAAIHRLCVPMLDALEALASRSRTRCESPGHLVGRRSRQVPRRGRRAQPARRDRREAPAPVPGGRRAVARCRVGGDARVRCAALMAEPS